MSGGGGVYGSEGQWCRSGMGGRSLVVEEAEKVPKRWVGRGAGVCGCRVCGACAQGW